MEPRDSPRQRVEYFSLTAITSMTGLCSAGEPPDRPPAVARPDAFKTLVNPTCSRCRDEAKRRAADGGLRPKPGEKPRFTPDAVEARRAEQKAWLRKRWANDVLPGTLTFHHVFSGELELTLDHEAMRWAGRSTSAMRSTWPPSRPSRGW